MLADTDRWLRARLVRRRALRFAPAEVWTDELLDWDRRLDLTRPADCAPAPAG